MNEDNSLLILDDDEIFCKRLQTAMSRKGFDSYGAYSIKEAKELLKNSIPKYAVIDLRLGDGNGLEVVSIISKQRKDSKIIILTGYGNIPTAVAAVKEGACDYLSKPADADDIEAALRSPYEKMPDPPINPMSADRVKWEHILRVYEQCNRNVSETARRLKCIEEPFKEFFKKKSPR